MHSDFIEVNREQWPNARLLRLLHWQQKYFFSLNLFIIRWERSNFLLVCSTMYRNPEQNKQTFLLSLLDSLWKLWFPCNLQPIHHAPFSMQRVNKDITVDFSLSFFFYSLFSETWQQWPTEHNALRHGSAQAILVFLVTLSFYFVIVVDHWSNNVINFYWIHTFRRSFLEKCCHLRFFLVP